MARSSNSGRLKSIMEQVFARQQQSWIVQIVPNPDTLLAQTTDVVLSADSVILDRCAHWFNLAAIAVARIPDAQVIDLRDSSSPGA